MIEKMEKQIMDFNVFIEQDEEGIYVAKVPEIEGCYTQGKTLEEVIERIKEAIEVCLEADKEDIIKDFEEDDIDVEESVIDPRLRLVYNLISYNNLDLLENLTEHMKKEENVLSVETTIQN